MSDTEAKCAQMASGNFFRAETDTSKWPKPCVGCGDVGDNFMLVTFFNLT